MAVLNANQINAYIATAREHRLFAAFVLDLTTGLRRGELLALKKDALDLTRGTVTVREGLYRTRLVDEGRSELQFNDPKTESGRRTIPLRPGVVRELREHLKRQAEERLFAGGAWQDNNLVFCTSTGTPIEPRNFSRCHAGMLKKAGLPHVTLHALRHSFASLVAGTGENPENLRAILGHSKTGTTMDLYCHANEEGKRRAVNRLEGLINI